MKLVNSDQASRCPDMASANESSAAAMKSRVHSQVSVRV